MTKPDTLAPMTWQEMHDMVRAAYIEGVKDTAEGAAIDDETLQLMWEDSDALTQAVVLAMGGTVTRHD